MAETPTNIDTSNYGQWEKVTGESGAVYYVVPESPGWVYDAFLSRAKGRPVFWINPAAQKKKQEEAKRSAQELQDAQIEASKPVNQLIPVAGSIGGLYAANKLSGMFDPATKAVEAGAQSLGGAAAQGAAEIIPSLPGASTGVQSALNYTPVGSTLDSAGAVEGVLPATGIAPYLGLAGAGLGAYGVYNAAKEGDVGSGALSGAGMGLGLGAAAPMLGLAATPLGWPALAGFALAGALGGGGIAGIAGMGDKNMFQTEQKRMQELADQGYQNLPLNQNPLQKGRSKEELIKIAEASGNQDAINFAKTRDENFISPEALSTHAQLIELAGKNSTQADRFKLAQDIVAAQRANGGILREHHGTIDIDNLAFDNWKKNQDPAGPQKNNNAQVNNTTPPAR